MRSRSLSLIQKILSVAGLVVAMCGSVHATPTLTAGAAGAGFGLSMFADTFPNTGFCCGPLGIAFVGGGKVMVADYPGNVRIFATDADGQHAFNAPVVQNYGFQNGVGLARSGNFVYLTEQWSGNVLRLNLDGTYNSFVVSLPGATGIYTNPANGKLYVSGNGGIYVVDPVLNTSALFKSGGFDGISISSDGATLYAETAGFIVGYRLSDGVQTFSSGFIAGADGTELGAGTLAGQLFVNTNNGELWEVSLADPTVTTRLVIGGSRGDFVTADPNGTLLFTHTDSIWRLTAPVGGCIGAQCGGDVPEPASLALLGVALLGLVSTRKRKVG